MQGLEFQNQTTVNYETAAKVVGVNKQPDTYKRPLDPTIANGFWGAEDRDDVVNQVHLDRSTKAFYGITGREQPVERGPAPQQLDQATEQFFGLPAPKKTEHVAPIPGYSGVSR